MDTTSNGNIGNGRRKGIKPIPAVLLGLVLLAGLWFGIPKLQYMRSHATTDNAYLAADITQIAPQVAGQVKQVLVSDNQLVKKGQLLVLLDDEKYLAAVKQAEANLAAAVADAKAAGLSVTLTQESAAAQIVQSEGGVDQSIGAIGMAEADVRRAQAAVLAAQAAEDKQKADVETLKLDVETAQDGILKAQRSIESSGALLEAARSSHLSAHASVLAAQAKAEQAERDAKRYDTLAASGAVSRQQKENADLALRTSQEQLRAAKHQADAALATVSQREAELDSARQQLSIAKAVYDQARSRLQAALSYSKALKSQTRAAVAQKQAAERAVDQAEGKLKQSKGLLNQANTGPEQVKVKLAGKEQALARIEQAKAALANARLDLEHTRIVSPIDGRVSKKSVQIGALVSVGTPLMAVVNEKSTYIYANFKETQISRIKPGQKVEIEIDSYPGRKYEGAVDSLSAATGATFALLPPDNATGNFVKVVQRVPVKIKFNPNQEGLDLLKAGLSAVVSVELSDR